MARPMILIKKELLETLLHEKRTGVPASALIRNHNLPITHPTLNKILACYHLVKDGKTPIKAKTIIINSLLPKWLMDQDKHVCTQPHDWYYTGNFPLGKWEVRVINNDDNEPEIYVHESADT